MLPELLSNPVFLYIIVIAVPVIGIMIYALPRLKD